MMAILRAPELSATSRIDRIWIMALLLRLVGRAGLVGQVGNSPAFLALPALPYPPCLPYLPYPPSLPYAPCSDLKRLAEHPFQRPSFPPAEGTRFHDFHRVPGLGRVLFVVHHELRRTPLGLAVESVTDLPLDGDDAAFLHPIADDDALLFGFRHLFNPVALIPFFPQHCL